MRTLVTTAVLALVLSSGLWMQAFSQQVSAPQIGLPAVDVQQSAVSVLSTVLPTGVQQIVVVDMRSQSMAVYHIEPTSGKIQLKSVRRVAMDLSIEQFNATEPLPSEMRLLKP